MRDKQRGQEGWWNPDFSEDQFRELGYRVVDMMVDYYNSVEERPVFPAVTSEEAAGAFEEPLPREGQDPHAILDEWTDKVLPHAVHTGSPRFFGFVIGSGTMMGTLAEALAASVNMNAGGWKAGPSATEIERQTIRWVAELVGYPASCGGLFTSGGTMANFTALLTALRNTAPYDTTDQGLQSQEREGRFLIYMADHEGHISISKVADMLNLGRASVRRVPSREDLTMDPQALEGLIREDQAQGEHPFCVVAQVGAINTGGIDPLEEIADICQEHGLWFHADGASGAFGRMLPGKQNQYRGLERADSVTLDPHKWLFIPYECGCVLVRDPEKLRRSFSMHAPYLRSEMTDRYTGLDYFEHGPQMSRGFRALKVWMTLKHYGVEGYRRLLSQSVRCAERLDELVRDHADFQALHEPNLHIYSFRCLPEAVLQHWEEDDLDGCLDRLNQGIADELQASGFAMVMTTRFRGQTALRLSICSHRTTPEDIEDVFARMVEIGRDLVEERL